MLHAHLLPWRLQSVATLPLDDHLSRLDPLYIGDVVLNRMYMSHLKAFVTFLPEKSQQISRAKRFLGSVTARFLQALPGSYSPSLVLSTSPALSVMSTLNCWSLKVPLLFPYPYVRA